MKQFKQLEAFVKEPRALHQIELKKKGKDEKSIKYDYRWRLNEDLIFLVCSKCMSECTGQPENAKFLCGFVARIMKYRDEYEQTGREKGEERVDKDSIEDQQLLDYYFEDQLELELEFKQNLQVLAKILAWTCQKRTCRTQNKILLIS